MDRRGDAAGRDVSLHHSEAPTRCSLLPRCGEQLDRALMSVVDPRDGQSKVMFFVNVDEQVNIQCSDDAYIGQTTWTRIPWG